MLPLLPAILLLLLNGPAGLDGVARDACLPEAIKALHRQIGESKDTEPKRALLKSIESELILASLLAGTSDTDLSKAISELLLLVSLDAPPPKQAPPEEPAKEQTGFIEPQQVRLSLGYCHTARSRDGPAVR